MRISVKWNHPQDKFVPQGRVNRKMSQRDYPVAATIPKLASWAILRTSLRDFIRRRSRDVYAFSNHLLAGVMTPVPA